jgi:hypothetical protein
MPAPENTGLQVNFKTPNGTLINIYAVDNAELSQKLEDIEGAAPQIAALEGVLSAASRASGITAPPSAQTPANPPSRPSTGPSSGGGLAGGAAPSCSHGPRVYKSGVSKAGKPFKLWACTSTNRNDQCSPQWVND